MTRIRDLAVDTIVYGLSVVLNPLVNTFILLKLLTTTLSKYDYGAYTYMYAFAGIFIVLYAMRMETTYFRMNNDYDEPRVFGKSLLVILGVSSLISLTLVVFSSNLSNYFENPAFGRYFRYFAIILWLDALCAIPFARLRFKNKSFKFSLIKITYVLVNLGFILAYLWILPSTFESTSYTKYFEEAFFLDGLFICNLITSLLLFLYFLPVFFKAKIEWKDTVLLKSILTYTLPLVVIGVAGNANMLLDRIVLPFISSGNIFEGMENNGIYGGATKIATVMLLFSKAFNYAFDPYMFKAYKQDKSTAQFGQIAWYYTAFSGFMMVTVVCLSFALENLLGSSFKSGMEYVPLLLLAYLLMGLFYHFAAWYKLADQTIKGAIIALVGMFITLYFNSILIDLWGLAGPALTMIINYTFISILCILWSQKYLSISYPWKTLLMHIVLSCLTTYAYLEYLRDLEFGHMYGLITIIGYGILILLLDSGLRKMLLNTFTQIKR